MQGINGSIKVISWNTARRRDVAAQTSFLLSRNPNIIALQEVTATTIPLFVSAFESTNFQYLRSSLPSNPLRSGPRSLGVLVASTYPIFDHPSPVRSPWPEKTLSLVVQTPQEPIEIHTVHVPPGSSNGWMKVEVLESIYKSLAVNSEKPRILCGDFNCPQAELPSGEIVTWGQSIDRFGRVRTKRSKYKGAAERWDQAERGVLVGLADFGLIDAYRTLHGYGVDAASWFVIRRDKQIGRRFDHIFVSPHLEVLYCDYLGVCQSDGLSDHAPIEAHFDFSHEIQ